MQIGAKIIAHSKSSVNGKEIVTFELDYPRFIHSELMTHRLFSRNAASSRAIPVAKMIEMVRQSPAAPVHWGKNQPGMVAEQEIIPALQGSAKYSWNLAARKAADMAEELSGIGVHKQIVNRILEPFQWMKTVVTATEFDNFFWLRNHPDAQPEIKRLAEVMWEALQNSKPVTLEPGDWHMPYFGNGYWKHEWPYATKFGNEEDGSEDEVYYLEDALAISSSCCAQVSYRKLDDSLEKARTIYQRLVESEPVHASPFEHQATPMSITVEVDCGWTKGTTHMDREYNLWSGNFKSWIQHRQLIPDNACWDYKE